MLKEAETAGKGKVVREQTCHQRRGKTIWDKAENKLVQHKT